jgi:hypothetical protein
VDIDGNSGEHRPLIRCKSGHDVAAEVDIRVKSTVGSGGTISTTTGETVHPTGVSQGDTDEYEIVVCPPISIPGGGVPSGRESGYAVSANVISETGEDTSRAVPADPAVEGFTFTLDKETILESVIWKLTSDGSAVLTTYIWSYDTATNKIKVLKGYSDSETIGSQAAAEMTHEILGQPVLQAGVYAALITKASGAASVTYRTKDTTNPYADGTRVSGSDRVADTTMTEYAAEDAYFKIVGRESLALAATMPIDLQETSGDGATFYTDILMRIPQDEGCVIATGMTLAQHYGIMADCMGLAGEDPDVYLYNRGAAGGSQVPVNSIMGNVVTYLPIKLRPGVVQLPVASDLPIDSLFVGGAYYPSYATPLEAD